MKLYLSSYRIPSPDDLFALLPDHPKQIRTALIVNAKDDKARSEADRTQKLAAALAYLNNLGLEAEFFDLKKYKSSDVLQRDLAQYPLIFVAGGNSFTLRYRMRKSGFDLVLPKLLEKGHVYIGESAGAVVAGPSLGGFSSMDDATGYKEDQAGLNLISSIIVPHDDSPDPRYRNRATDIAKVNPGLTVLPLKDSQAYIVNGKETKLVTAT